MADEKAKEVKMGPGRRGRGMGPKPKLKNPRETFSRLIKYSFGAYKLQIVVVAVCIIINVLCTLKGTMFLQTLIDDYIQPMLESGSTDFTEMTNMGI